MTYDFGIIRHLRKKIGLTIYGLSEQCGVSYVALSKLERNRGNPELKTLDKIARALNIETHNLLALAEHDRPITVTSTISEEKGFSSFRGDFKNVRVSIVTAPKGTSGGADHEHQEDYETCMVLEGKLRLHIRDSNYDVKSGQAIYFDCIFDHHYEVLEDVKFVHVLVAKR